ncbi:hypothetical protein QTN25_007592 [Entamoeba marina]
MPLDKVFLSIVVKYLDSVNTLITFLSVNSKCTVSGITAHENPLYKKTIRCEEELVVFGKLDTVQCRTINELSLIHYMKMNPKAKVCIKNMSIDIPKKFQFICDKVTELHVTTQFTQFQLFTNVKKLTIQVSFCHYDQQFVKYIPSIFVKSLQYLKVELIINARHNKRNCIHLLNALNSLPNTIYCVIKVLGIKHDILKVFVNHSIRSKCLLVFDEFFNDSFKYGLTIPTNSNDYFLRINDSFSIDCINDISRYCPTSLTLTFEKNCTCDLTSLTSLCEIIINSNTNKSCYISLPHSLTRINVPAANVFIMNLESLNVIEFIISTNGNIINYHKLPSSVQKIKTTQIPSTLSSGLVQLTSFYSLPSSVSFSLNELENLHVKELGIHNMNIYDMNSIVNFTSITKLDIMNHQSLNTVTLPPSLLSLKLSLSTYPLLPCQLTNLHLEKMNKIPSNFFSKLDHLKTLSVCHIKGTLPMFDFPFSIEELSLSYCQTESVLVLVHLKYLKKLQIYSPFSLSKVFVSSDTLMNCEMDLYEAITVTDIITL